MEYFQNLFQSTPNSSHKNELLDELHKHELINYKYNENDRASKLGQKCDEFRNKCLFGDFRDGSTECERLLMTIRKTSAKVVLKHHDMEYTINFITENIQ